MPSVRKQYRGANGGEPPAPVVETVSPVDEAAQAAITEKMEEQTVSPLRAQIGALREAEKIQRRQATEPAPQMPDTVRAWAEKHPDYFSDPVLYAEWNLACTKTWRDGIHDWSAPEFVPALEKHLEHLSPASPAPEAPKPEAAPEPMAAAPEAPAATTPAPQPYQGFAVSAPISRDAPSMSTGRPIGASTVKLTAEEIAMARSLNLTPEKYLQEKIKLIADKRAGLRQ
jgi:hypothetical protein